jgi:Zn-finger nucleic acid-binding protein
VVFGHPAASLVFALAGFVLLVFALNVAGPLKNARGWITDPLDNRPMTAANGGPNAAAAPDAPEAGTAPEVSLDRVARRLPSGPPPWRVFLSHTCEFRRFPSRGGSYIDKAERAVIAAEHRVGNMEHYRASDGDTGRFDEEQVRGSQVYVGIFGMRWGTPVPGTRELSYTVQEFEAASAAGIPRLIFVLDEDDDSGDVRLPSRFLRDDEHGQRQQAFLRRIESGGELIIKRFRSPDHLAGLVETSLRELEKQLGLVAGGDAAPARRGYSPQALASWVSATSPSSQPPSGVCLRCRPARCTFLWMCASPWPGRRRRARGCWRPRI